MQNIQNRTENVCKIYRTEEDRLKLKVIAELERFECERKERHNKKGQVYDESMMIAVLHC